MIFEVGIVSAAANRAVACTPAHCVAVAGIKEHESSHVMTHKVLDQPLRVMISCLELSTCAIHSIRYCLYSSSTSLDQDQDVKLS